MNHALTILFVFIKCLFQKNEANRTEKQQIAFKAIDQATLNTAKAWHIRGNFKILFSIEKKTDIAGLFDQWMTTLRKLKLAM